MSNLTHYICPRCKSEFLKLSKEESLCCPYCQGNASPYTPKDDSGMPDFLIPFKVTKEEAMAKFLESAKKVPFLPDEFQAEDFSQRLKGIYIPFWLFDGKCNAKLSYHAQIVRRHTNSAGRPYKIHASYNLDREGNVDFTDIPVDASKAADNFYTEALEPYDSSDIVPFKEEYLKDFIAEKYNVSKDEAEQRANQRLKNTLVKDFFETTIDFDTVLKDNEKYKIYQKNSDCNLLPVWLLNIIYNEKIYRYAVNGQTGKVVGEIPISTKKRAFHFIKVFFASFAVTSLLFFLLNLILSLFDVALGDLNTLFAFIALAIALVTSVIADSKKLRPKTIVSGNNFADSYVDKGDYKLIRKRDRFLRSDVYFIYSGTSMETILNRRAKRIFGYDDGNAF